MGHTLKNAILLAVSLLLAAVIAEVVLRAVMGSPVPWKYPQETYLHDPELGHRLEPGQKSFTHDRPVVTNSQGIRDSEYPQEPARGVYRILALGDSQTFGNGLDIEDTWPKLLQAELNKRGDGQAFEVLNCGIPGTDTWQHELWLERMLETYRPDGVVLAFYVNDVVPRPRHIVNTRAARSEAGDRFSYALRRSALVMAVHSAINAIRLSFWPDHGYLRHQSLMRGDKGPNSMERWQQVQASFVGMQVMTARRGVDFMVLSLPRRDQVDGRLDAEAYNEMLASIARRSDVQLVEMLGPLQQSYAEFGNALFIQWDGHNTAIANRVIAGVAADAVIETGSASGQY